MCYAEPEQNQPDAIEQIKKLAELKDAGVLTDEEFQAKKEKLLAEI
ncbi:SHOCT domain-containing protein [Salinivibrio kushneri]|nr:SHOCT domain-containing protein [Salinivibrio kushneri]WBA11420.1 SHOCT domain-containing protein [Salinivibrio kushneri]